jgi:hypothetical protein
MVAESSRDAEFATVPIPVRLAVLAVVEDGQIGGSRQRSQAGARC